jgi:hypothetical protein
MAPESGNRQFSGPDDITASLRPIGAKFRHLEADLAALMQRVAATRQEIRELSEKVSALAPR